MAVYLKMRNGDQWMLAYRYSVQGVTETLDEARKSDELVTFERDLTPTGQKVTVDPRAVESVAAESW